MSTNQQIHLDNRPVGEALASNFKLVTAETPALQDGQVLVRHHFLSLDPYMRGRMNDVESYVPPFQLDAPLDGGAVGTVIASRHADASKSAPDAEPQPDPGRPPPDLDPDPDPNSAVLAAPVPAHVLPPVPVPVPVPVGLLG